MADLTGFFRIQIRKEALKFSAAHMTVFADGTKENLHGHNYQTVIKLEFERFSLDTMIPFSETKNAMRAICGEWDEKILLPAECPFIKFVRQDTAEIEILACGKRYVFPSDEVVLLPVDNVTTESLAKIFGERLSAALPKEGLNCARVRSIETTIEEISGQGATYVIPL